MKQRGRVNPDARTRGVSAGVRPPSRRLVLCRAKGPRGGVRSFPLTRADMARLVDTYSRSRGPSPRPERAAARHTTRQEGARAERGIPAERVIAEYLGISIEDAMAWWEHKQAEATANDDAPQEGGSGAGMIGKRLRHLLAWAVRRAAHLRRRRGGPSGSVGAGAVPGERAGRGVFVTPYDAGMALCAVVGCGRVAELLVLVSPPRHGQWLWPWCVEHWESVRQGFVRPGDQVEHGPGAAERINERTRDRLKAELARLHPVEHPAEYNRVFTELVALEQQRRRQRRRQQGHGRGDGSGCGPGQAPGREGG